MEKERVHKTQVLVIPLPVQGHINPMLQFSKRLASKGLKVTMVTAFSNNEAMETQENSIEFEPISDRLEESNNIENMVKWFQSQASKRLPELIVNQENHGYPISCLVYDSAMPWILDLAKGLGIFGASFFTHSCAVASIYYNLHQGLLKVPLEEPLVSLAGLPSLKAHDLPSFVYDPGSYPSFLKLVISRFSNITEANWIFFSSFDGLEKEVISWMRTLWPIKTIGPTIPSIYLDKRLKEDTDYGFGCFNPNTDTCMKWLDSKEEASVVYISFGSMADLGKEQMEELAEGLKMIKNNFLWVIRGSEMEKLPSKFLEETSVKGLVLNWCPQLEVLAHRSTGCFVTHCGWNSTLEAVSLGVPMVVMPQWTDQTTNAKFVSDVWNVGLRVEVNQNGIVPKEEIELCIREVMQGERGKGIKRNSVKWRELAKEAVDEGGTSDKNIEEFVAQLLCKPC
ncbi:UDP-glucuronosyl/UDP-glucosyltransferase [Parasponia andersonii]|uniref:Glycosyltransferase n=1 Tax=Parasponia andersonii TaxID=3476 RepID=A0A2P5DTJ0_PARAD|nr:UDP-glucuronosyl/UDP-glucosyltransferase [Parasponia andersonii]